MKQYCGENNFDGLNFEIIRVFKLVQNKNSFIQSNNCSSFAYEFSIIKAAYL